MIILYPSATWGKAKKKIKYGNHPKTNDREYTRMENNLVGGGYGCYTLHDGISGSREHEPSRWRSKHKIHP